MTPALPDGLSGSYAERSVRFLDLARVGDWRVKTYSTSAYGDRPDPALVRAAGEIARRDLPTPAVRVRGGDDGEPFGSLDRYGVGVLVVHEAREGTFVLLD